MEQKKKFIVNVVFYGLIGVLLIAFCKYLLPILIPFVIASIIHVSVERIIPDLNKKKLLAMAICLVFWVGVAILAVILGTKFVQMVGNLIMAAPDLYNDQIVPVMGKISSLLSEKLSGYDAGVSVQIQSTISDLTKNMGQYISEFSIKAVTWLSQGIKGIPGGVVRIIITVIASFFMTADYKEIMQAIQKIIPEKQKEMANGGTKYIKNVIGIYLKSYTLLFVLTFIELSIGLTILRIPYSVIIALGIAIFDILPVLGTGGILLPWAVILFIVGKVPLGVGILILYLVITVIRNILEPKIVGKQIGLHPLITLISLFIGLKLFGIIGMIVLPVSLSVLMNLYKNGFFKKENTEKEGGQAQKGGAVDGKYN